jgi:hypothetical protein
VDTSLDILVPVDPVVDNSTFVMVTPGHFIPRNRVISLKGKEKVTYPQGLRDFEDVLPIHLWSVVWEFSQTVFQKRIWEMVRELLGIYDPIPPRWELCRQMLGWMPMGLPVGPSLWHFFCHWVYADADLINLEMASQGWIYRDLAHLREQ